MAKLGITTLSIGVELLDVSLHTIRFRSGKTYTMQGDENALYDSSFSSPSLGIVGRALSHLFSTCAAKADDGWNYSIKFEMIEIYNENIKDLLHTGVSNFFIFTFLIYAIKLKNISEQ